jgi:hypothetical protein
MQSSIIFFYLNHFHEVLLPNLQIGISKTLKNIQKWNKEIKILPCLKLFIFVKIISHHKKWEGLINRGKTWKRHQPRNKT